MFGRPVAASEGSNSMHESYAPSVHLPSDYLRFLATFGPGTFAMGDFPILAVADLTSPADDTAGDLFAVLYDDEFLVAGEKVSGFRGVPGVIPWAHDFEETTFYWVANAAEPDKWKVAIDNGRRTLELFSGTTVELMLSYLRDRFASSATSSPQDDINLQFITSRDA